MSTDSDLRSIKTVLVVYLAVFVMKLWVYLVTGVYALFAEALHTLADIFVTGFLLIALVISRRTADEDHMYGHGRAQNAAALVAATLFISFTSFKLYEEAVPRLYTHHEAVYSNLWLAVYVLVASMVIAAAPLIWMFMKKRTQGAAAKAQLMELVNDELGLLAALAGTLFIIHGEAIADPIAAIIVATIIAVNAVGLFRENFTMLMGGHPGAGYLRQLEEQARSVKGVLDLHDLKIEYIGPDQVHVDLHIVVEKGLLVEEGDAISEEVCDRVQKFTGSKYCVVHLDTAGRKKADGPG